MTSTKRHYGTRASDGALEIEIEASEAVREVDGKTVKARVYNGELPGPTFVVGETERVRIVFTNRMSEPTNLHLHGMHMAPEVDDPHRVAAPGETLVYEFVIPAGAAGTYWYHPHVHGEVARQLGEGLAGAFVVVGPDDLALPLAGAEEHILMLQDLSVAGDRTPMEMHDGREGELVLVHGNTTPAFEVCGGLLRVRLVNASSARFYDVVLDGAELVQIGLDASLLGAPVIVDHVLLPPGQRVDLLIRAATPGRLTLRHRPYDRGAFRMPWSRIKLPNQGVLATFDVTTGCEAAGVELPSLGPIERLDPTHAVATRILEYGGKGNALRMVLELVTRRRYGAGEGADGPVRFWLNGKEFEPRRIDAEAELDTLEIWEIRNPTPLDHPFHLHIYPFQVLDVDGKPPAFTAWQDVVTVPAKSTVRILVPFRDFTGVTMFHCHILEHEDNGMMAHLRVIDRSAPASEPATCASH